MGINYPDYLHVHLRVQHSLGCWKFFFFLLEKMSEAPRKARWAVLRICIFTPCQCIWHLGVEQSLFFKNIERLESPYHIRPLEYMVYLSFIFEPKNFWQLTRRWSISMMQRVIYEESWLFYVWDDATLTGQLVPLGERFSCTFFNTHHDVYLYWS